MAAITGFYVRLMLLMTVCFVALMVVSGVIGRVLPHTDEIRYMAYSSNNMNQPDNLIAHMLDIRHGISLRYGEPLPRSGGGWSPDGNYFVRRLPNSTIITDGESTHEVFPGDVAPVWSPDGNHLVFEVHGLGIYAANPDGTNAHQITPLHGEYYAPQYSPDGTQLVMIGNRNNFEIYVSGIEGEDLHPITNNFEFEMNPAWSPDSMHIAFLRNTTQGTHLFVIDADGQNEIDLTPDLRNVYNFYWSPDGGRIAFTDVLQSGAIQVYDIGIDGTAPQPIPALLPANDIQLFGWTPDGGYLVLHREDFMNSSGGRQPHVDLVDATTGIVWRQIYGYGSLPAFSPDGQSIVYTTTEGRLCIQQLEQRTKRCYTTISQLVEWVLWLS